MQEVDSGPTVMVADAPSASPDLLAEILVECGYRVVHCTSEAEALAAAERSPPDFIVLSLDQPGADGAAVCRRLSADPLLRQVPVILLSESTQARRTLLDWRQRQALRVDERTRQLLEAQKIAGLGAWQIDIERDRIEWIGETHRMFGFSSDEPLSFRASVEHVHPDDRPRVLAAWEAALAVPAARYDVTYRVRVDGRERWLR